MQWAEKKKKLGDAYEPQVSLGTRLLNGPDSSPIVSVGGFMLFHNPQGRYLSQFA